ncbi:MAG: YnbE family lipoprotein [Terasakiella sp.]|uniref:YnbE family lipoprotein n=1 Tax=unclassified Terasakiella TaxID=2614952 RepID=UPI003B0077E1
MIKREADVMIHRHSLGGLCLAALLGLNACTPTVQVAAPSEPITINLNIKLDADVRLKLEKTATNDIKENPEVF